MAQKTRVTATLNASLAVDTLTKMARALENREQVLGTIADYAQAWERRVFDSQGAAGGKTAWASDAESTIESKGSDSPNRSTGALMAAATGAPRLMKASVQIRTPAYGLYEASGRYGPRSKIGTGKREGWRGLGGSAPRRNPAPKPPKEEIGALMGQILDAVFVQARS